jgi:NAD+ kinase
VTSGKHTHGPPVLVVYKKSNLDLYVREKKNARYAQLLEEGAEVVSQMEGAHATHGAALEAVMAALAERNIKHRAVYRGRLRSESTKGHLVVTVGGDGTLLDASRKVNGAVVLGVNSDPRRSVGFLCAATSASFGDVLDAVRREEVPPTPVARLSLALDGEPIGHPVLNDVLVADRNPAATARYVIERAGVRESHKSSGIWIAAPAGSTAATLSAGGEVQSLDDGRMQVRIREPFLLDEQPPTLRSAWVSQGEPPLSIVSKMREGRLFLDGAHHRLQFPVGTTLTIGPSASPLQLIVTDAMRTRREELAASTAAARR